MKVTDGEDFIREFELMDQEVRTTKHDCCGEVVICEGSTVLIFFTLMWTHILVFIFDAVA